MERNMKNESERTTKSHRRLSVDLTKYRDVAEMLDAAVLASGETATALTISALQKQLPAMMAERHRSTKEFLKRYPGTTVNSSKTLRQIADGIESEARAGVKSPRQRAV